LSSLDFIAASSRDVDVDDAEGREKEKGDAADGDIDKESL